MNLRTVLSKYDIRAIVFEMASTPLYEVINLDIEIFLLNDPCCPFVPSAFELLKKRVHCFDGVEELLAAVLPGTIRGAAIALLLGIESSLAELGVVLIAALIWRGMGHSVGRAATIGVGAGAFEALLLAGASLLAGAALALGLLDPALMSSGSAAASATRFLWLLGSVERLIAVMCHVGSRTLVIIGIVQRRMSMVAAGFMIFAGLDSVAAWLHVVGRAGTRSLWWTELGMFPWAVAAAAGLWWCVRVEAGAHCDSSRSGD